MSTLRRMTRTANKPGLLTEDQRYHLLKGFTLLDITDPWFEKMGFPFRSESHRKELYFKHRDELLEATGPDRRPHGWWTYSAPSPRRRIVVGNPDFALWDRGLYFGKAKISKIGPKEDGYPVYESTTAYCKRLKL